jgi:hypothetical protein
MEALFQHDRIVSKANWIAASNALAEVAGAYAIVAGFQVCALFVASQSPVGGLYANLQ